MYLALRRGRERHSTDSSKFQRLFFDTVRQESDYGGVPFRAPREAKDESEQ
jgi:hypothetical protein